MISLSNVSVPASAMGGSLVAQIRVTDEDRKPVLCNLKLGSDSDAFFGIVQSNAHLVTTWAAPPAPGFYGILIQANAINGAYSDMAEFVVRIT